MATAYPFAAEKLAEVIKPIKRSVAVEHNHLSSISDGTARFTHQLQTTLDTSKLMNIFAEQAATLLRFDGISYTDLSHQVDISIGNKGHHKCRYQLTLEEENLGEMTISRKQRFIEEELVQFESLLALLLYPLRNCLHFQQAKQAASKDPMTGLNNRRSMDEHIAHESRMAMRYDSPLSMLVLDIDHFKKINDSYGHKAGDCLIKALADIMKQTARTTDYTFRYGGEEFVMLLPNTSTEGAKLLAERIRKTVEETECLCHGEVMRMTISIGISTLTTRDIDDSLFLRADSALYQAKHSGRNRVTIAE